MFYFTLPSNLTCFLLALYFTYPLVVVRVLRINLEACIFYLFYLLIFFLFLCLHFFLFEEYMKFVMKVAIKWFDLYTYTSLRKLFLIQMCLFLRNPKRHLHCTNIYVSYIITVFRGRLKRIFCRGCLNLFIQSIN